MKQELTTLGELLVHDPKPEPVAPIILTPGVHLNVDIGAYLSQPALSASVLCEVDQKCPYAGWYSSYLNPRRAPDFNDESDVGEIAHAILLEGTMSRVAVIDPEQYPAKNGNTPQGWTNPSIRAARDEARDAGLIPMLPCDVAVVNAVVDSAHKYIDSLKDTEPAIWRAFQPGGGDSEVSAIWSDDGILCRIRADRINKERDLIVDVKTTKRSAEPDSWARSMFGSMGLRLRGAWYGIRGAQAVFGQRAAYVMLVIEQDAPYLCSLVGLDPTNLEIGKQRMEGALGMWRQCMADNFWPAYPPHVAYPVAPGWEVAELEAVSGDLPTGYDFKREGFPL